MEKCHFCNIEFSVIGHKAEKRLKEFETVTGQIACDNCQKKIKKAAHEEIIRDVVKEYMGQSPEMDYAIRSKIRSQMETDPLTTDVIYDMIMKNDPAVEKLFTVEEEK